VIFNARFWSLIAITLTAAAARLLPHPPNFTPIGAMALFGGAYFARKDMAFAVPLTAMFLSDLVLGLTTYGHEIWKSMPFVYVGFALTVWLGRVVRSNPTPVWIAAATLAGSGAFFIIANFGVWMTWDFYPKTLDGLAACYIAAIPFSRYMLAANLFYTAVLFGGFNLLERTVHALREQPSLAKVD
jgi:hypothetical protein